MEALPEVDCEEDVAVTDDEEDDEASARDLESGLSVIRITPTVAHIANLRPQAALSNCPSSYKENSSQEKLMLAMAENFREQYALLYPDHKALLLCPVNEYGVQKFVSTTLRSTLLPYPELYDWEGCASFVADYLSLELLDPPFELPKQLSSPTWVLQAQKGTCFDFCNVLCSLLLGAGYNAYCVSGYAAKEMCLLDQSRQECPLLQLQIQDKTEEPKKPIKKYSVKTPRDLQSNFERRQEEKRQAEAEAAALKEQQEAERLQKERERPAPDPLRGLRVHCWVLVLSGNREVPENFFIDPLTGKSYSTTNDNFLGIESVWNHQNYWVNKQDCTFGCNEMTFDLGDLSKWEYVLCGQSPSIISDPKTLEEPEDEEEEDMDELKVFEMPPSWVTKINISPADMEMRYPGGMKVIQYRKAKLEKFAPYLLKDGLVTKLTTYEDIECTQASTIKEWFKHRSDHLDERELHTDSNVTTEHFRPGRSDALKYHRYITLVPETERQMDFYSHIRTDGLARRIEKPFEMTETFEDRTDFLFYRHVVYGKQIKLTRAREALEQRPLQRVEEQFHRDHSNPASSDVAERVFIVSDRRIQVTFHLEDDRIIPAWLNFIKPKEAADSQKAQAFTPEMVSGFQVDPSAKPYKNLQLYEILVELMRQEENVQLSIRDSEREVRSILSSREKEDSDTDLLISIYNPTRNETARLHMEEKERMAKEKKRRKKEKELDLLAPSQVRLGLPEVLTRQDALQLKTDCLNEFKQQLFNKASLIQSRIEKETEELQKKQLWYQKNSLSMSKEDEDDYLTYCSDAMFRIQVLQLRLIRHKERAPQKYLALEEKLKRHPRLASQLL
ncbi:dynein regulatory complex subunit 7 isoform X1 [Puntigrus tetrazona]|uniref:dynein regulatory complex subunit 7 isoform X1 n=1 Tax=Puntigrus tetrazona TaxID=1606681 RepID=UPI001C8A7C88|nr:dynein regulatory complex subunit 7 isoform X1 [Puntigrus tetrazona]XP_043083582.1 dynein regulatory complex subunit 7 isoform X1 [Puntigrus tetrazona]